MVIFFDELNRVQNPSVMSAVFDAISDHRIFGVDFDPTRVKIFAACNLGENTQDAQPLDPAFAARFSIYKKKDYDLTDAESFINYAKSSGFDTTTLSFFENLENQSF